jgi:AcrR family transcriptional regulator
MGRAETRSEQIEEPLLPRGPHAISPEVVAADQRRRLLAALPLVVAEHGFEETTVAQIVKAAKVRRNSFYEQFEDKRDCFGAAYELAQERLLGVVTFRCYTRVGVAERVQVAVAAALELLRSEPAMARLIVVEAPAAGDEILARHHQWLDRYGRMLCLAAIGADGARPPGSSIEPAIVGGVAALVAKAVRRDETDRLGELAPEVTAHLLSFYGLPAPLPVAASESAPAELDGSSQPQSSLRPAEPAPEPAPA